MHPHTIPGDETNTQPSPRRAASDAHGQAGLLLVESLLHALVETKSLTLSQAIGIVQTAVEVSADTDRETEGGTRQSQNLLSAIQRSLALENDTESMA